LKHNTYKLLLLCKKKKNDIYSIEVDPEDMDDNDDSEKEINDTSGESFHNKPSKRRNRRVGNKGKKSSIEKDDASFEDDPMSKIVDIMEHTVKNPQIDGYDFMKHQSQLKLEEEREKTKQLE
jgi:hypothetical protein